MSPLIRRRRSRGRRRGTPALLIAAITIIVPVLVIYYAFHQRLPFTSRYTDYAVVPNSVDVRGGSPVRIAGIDVGEVTGVSAHGNATKITFVLNSDGRPIHTDATVTIRDRLFLEGSYYLDLFPGSPSAPIAREGFTIPEPSTSTPVQFFQVLSTFDVAARTNLAQLLNTANQAFSPSAGRPQDDSGAGSLKQALPQLTPLAKDIAWVSQSLTGTHATDVQRLLTSASQVTGTLASQSSNLAGLVTGLDHVSTELAAADGDLAASISGFDATLKAAPPSLAAFDRALPPLTRLARALTPSLRASPALVSSLTGVVDEVNAVVAPSVRNRLIESLHTLLVQFPSVLGDLGQVFPASLPVAECLAEKIIPVLEATPSGPGSLGNGDPVWKDFVHALPGLAAVSSAFDANGHSLRVAAGSGSGSVVAGGSALGTLPGAGELVGTLPPGSAATSSLSGVAPQWVGDLSASDFRPDVSCASDPVPSLTSITDDAAPDLRSAHLGASASVTASAAEVLREIQALGAKGSAK